MVTDPVKCTHPKTLRQPTMLNPEDNTLAYCHGCLCVVRLAGDVWVPDSAPGQITKATYR